MDVICTLYDINYSADFVTILNGEDETSIIVSIMGKNVEVKTNELLMAIGHCINAEVKIK